MTGLAFRTLGPPKIERDGERVHVGRRKAVALLAYLAVTQRPHSRDSLAALFWPAHDRSSSRKGLRNLLSVLNRALGYELLAVDREMVGISPDADFWLDVHEFRQLLRNCERHGHQAGAECNECGRRLAEAAGLYQDDFLAGFTLPDSPSFDDWQLFETEGLRDELSSVLERLALFNSAQGAHESAIRHARRWVELDWLNEVAQRTLMQVYSQAGQSGAALRQYEECARVLQVELGLRPSQETTALHETIRAGLVERTERVPSGTSARPDLPVQPIPFVGRARELSAIGERLADPSCHLLTLVGPGGSGKTRLAIEAAAACMDEFEHGVHFVSLARLQSPDSIVPSIAQAVRFSFYGQTDPTAELLAHLSRRQMLLILDNFEHLLSRPGAAGEDGSQLVSAIVAAAPGVKILVTSRVALGVQLEQLFPVSGMPYPEWKVGQPAGVAAQEATTYGAVQLFMQCAGRVAPGFEPSSGNVRDVIRICELVAGMPLGILLAASWVRLLSPGEIAEQLEMGHDLLQTDGRDVPERQRSMRAVFDHSWDLLSAREKLRMQALSVFRGGFSREAARDVARCSLAELRSLVDGSLVQRTSAGRYEMHELLRQYAAERLDRFPDASERVGDRHCVYYAAMAERWGAALRGPRQVEALAEADEELENVRRAWNWAAERAQADRLNRAIFGLCWFYDWRARWQESEADCAAAAGRLRESLPCTATDLICWGTPKTYACDLEKNGLSAAERLRVLARVVRWQGASSYRLGRVEAGGHLVRQSLALLEQLQTDGHDTSRDIASALNELAYQASDFDMEECRRHAEQSLALRQSLGEPWWIAHALLDVGKQCLNLGAYRDARGPIERSLRMFEALGDKRWVAWSTCRLGESAMALGQLDEAEHLLREAISAHEGVEDSQLLVAGLFWLGVTLCYSGEFVKARSMLERAALAESDDVGIVVVSAFSSINVGLVGMLLGDWDRASAAARTGSALSREAGSPLAIGRSLWLQCCLALAGVQQGLAARMVEAPSGVTGDHAAYHDAQRLARECTALHRVARARDDLARGLAVLGETERGLGSLSHARRHLAEALQMSADSGAFLPPLFALPAVALALADGGEKEQAVELYALASRYPFVSKSRWHERVFGRRIAESAGELPPEVVAAAKERGRARDVQATLKELLAEWG